MWLKNWSERNSLAGSNPEVGKYIGIYFALGIGSSALTVVQTLILWIFCSIEVSSARPLTRNSLDSPVPSGVAKTSRTYGDSDLQVAYVVL